MSQEAATMSYLAVYLPVHSPVFVIREGLAAAK